ncbi:MAG: prephenate dehydratase [Chthonomonas sp.]|nr:prephenate dehydratase [Chthonomonas sp.]
MDEAGKSLEELRLGINEVDAQVLALLSERTRLAQEIGDLKGRSDQPYFNPERERDVLERLRDLNEGPLSAKQVAAIFREIMSAARAAERTLRIAFWGPPGTFTHRASLQTFGASAEYFPVDTIGDVFEAVQNSRADYGVVPVENSTAGVVPETLDMFPLSNVKICAETHVEIHHHLISTATSLEQVQRVYAGPQPAAQCRKWLKGNLPWAEIIDMAPTAKAAEKAKSEPNSAAIANSLAAELVDIPILVDHIEDNAHNRTRFLVLGYNEPRRTGRDKTSLMFTLKNKPGELYRALGAFERAEVNLMMIESRPAQRSTFEYIFYTDCAGHHSDAPLLAALDEVRAMALDLQILGSYPA